MAARQWVGAGGKQTKGYLSGEFDRPTQGERTSVRSDSRKRVCLAGSPSRMARLQAIREFLGDSHVRFSANLPHAEDQEHRRRHTAT